MHTLLASILVFSLSFFVLKADASTIEKVKGQAAIVHFDEGETAAEGDKYFAIENGKKKAILEVVQFKKDRAKVKVLKGTAKEGMSVTVAKKSGAKAQQAEAAPSDDEAVDAHEETPKGKHMRSAGAATLFKDMTFGALVGYAMDSQTVTPSGGTAQAMTGSGYSLKGFADIPVTGSLALLTRAGIEQFSVTGGSSKTDIMYATLDLSLKYAFGGVKFIPFVMGGLALHFPVSKTTNILDANRVSSTTVFYGGGGFNYVLSGTSYLQATAEYGMFPPSNDVSTSLIAVRVGMGFRF